MAQQQRAFGTDTPVRPVYIPDLRQIPPDTLLTRKQVSAVSGYALITLAKWATTGRGPRITRVEGYPRYRAEDVRKWLGGNASTAPKGTAFGTGVFA